MAQKLDANLRVIQDAPIEIALIDGNLHIIAQLDDEPNDVGGLTAAELKAKFDEAGVAIQTYINESLIPAILAADATEIAREEAETERVENETERVTNEQNREKAEVEREKNIAKVENLTVSSEALEYGEPASAEVTTNPETGGLNVHFGLPMGKDGLSFLPVIEGDDVPDGVEAWIDPSIESYQGGGGGGDGKPEVYVGPDEPTNGEAIWINPDEEEGSFLTKEETEALVNSVAIPYETGTWNPIFGYAVETTPATITTRTGFNDARYIKIGNLVYVTMHYSGFSLTDAGSGAAAVIRNLPFRVDGNGAMCALNWGTGVTTENALYGGANAKYNCFYPVTANFTNLTWKANSEVPTNGEIRFAAVYLTDE